MTVPLKKRDRYVRSWTFAVVVIFLAACGGGGGGGSDNQPPQVSAVGDRSISANEASAPIAFTVNDRNVQSAAVTATSSDQAVLPDSGLSLSGNQGAFNLVLNPAPDTLGMATVTITATDTAGLSTQSSFLVTVAEQTDVSFRNYFRAVFADDPNATPRDINTRLFVDDAGDDDYADLLN